jgi:membrane protein
MRLFQRFQEWLQDVAHVPWFHAVSTLRERFREDRLGLTASSLTFTTTIALVPFITVALAIFTAFPMFAKFQDVLQKWLIESLVPDNIARQVLGYLNQFAGKASKLGTAGLAALAVTAFALIFTIDRTLNSIWRVRTPRSMGQRLLLYWSAMTLGPLLLGASVTMTSYAVSASKGLVLGMPGGFSLILDSVQFLMVAAGMAAMFHYVPNTHVRWGHAWMGGVFVAAGLELAKKILAMYLAKVPTYSAVYGAFATLPILLVWIYLAWVIVLLGAALTAHVPSLLAGLPRRRVGPGVRFQLALEVLQQLQLSRSQGVASHRSKGQTMAQLCDHLSVDSLQLEPVTEALMALDWIGLLQEEQGEERDARFIVLIDPAQTPIEPLARALLLSSGPQGGDFWSKTLKHPCMLAEVL